MFSGNIKKHKPNDPSFPEKLKVIPDPPKQLFIKGVVPEDTPMIAIVGTRRPSRYGREVTEQFATYLAKNGWVIVSGLALGIDTIAHKSAIHMNTPTVAVLPGSVETVYPPVHSRIAQSIVVGGGALVSERPQGSSVHKYMFLARNRLISGLSDGVLITEASAQSGTMSTAASALEQGKTVMVIPGNINSPLSQGTNNLLKQGATPVTAPEDVLFALGYAAPSKPSITPDISKEAASVLGYIQAGQESTDAILAASHLDFSELSRVLTELELVGLIRNYEGHWKPC